MINFAAQIAAFEKKNNLPHLTEIAFHLFGKKLNNFDTFLICSV